MIEDPLYLPKDTKVFIICNPYDNNHMSKKIELEHNIMRYGYETNIQYYVKAKDIRDQTLGFTLPLSSAKIGDDSVYQWYTLYSVLIKARILRKKYIITFANFSRFDNDIRRTSSHIQLHEGKRLLLDHKSSQFIIDNIHSIINKYSTVENYIANE
jgi:hypothetical protein